MREISHLPSYLAYWVAKLQLNPSTFTSVHCLDWADRAGRDRSLLQGPVPERRPSAARAAARSATGLSLWDRSLGDRSLRQRPVPES